MNEHAIYSTEVNIFFLNMEYFIKKLMSKIKNFKMQ